MPMDGLTLGYMARELDARLQGGKIDRIMQPERDEVHMMIRSGGENHRLLLSASPNHARAQLTQTAKPAPDTPPMLCTLLRKHLLGGRVAAIEQIGGDRILRITINSHTELGDAAEFTLVCEFMGRHSNMMLIGPDGTILDAARHVGPDVSRVRMVMPGCRYEAPPSQDKLPPAMLTPERLAARLEDADASSLPKALGSAVAGLSPTAAEDLCAQARLTQRDGEGFAEALCRVLAHLPMPDARVILREDGLPADFTPFAYLTREGVPQRAADSLSQAMDAYYFERDRSERIGQKTASLEATLKTALARAQRKLAAQLEDIESAKNAETHRIRGDLLIGSLHAPPPPGAREARVTDWFSETQESIAIPLDPTMDLRANAQRYYKLYRKAKSASVMAAEQAVKSRAEIDLLEDVLQSLSVCQTEGDIDEVRRQLVASGHLRATHNRKNKRPAPTKPMHFGSSDGVPIEVGKTAAQNEQLLASADGDDLWMHAKDMPGSHVLLRLNGAQASETAIREAAMLAALYSKGAASSGVPVDRTLRKYVKKPSGARPGYVIYTNQQTVFVTPDKALAERLRT